MYLLIAYTLAAGGWAVAANFGAPHGLPITIDGAYVGDKVIHFAVVGTFAVAIAQAVWRLGYRPERSLIIGMVLAMLLSTMEELTNLLTPHRDCSVLDLAADLSGIVVLAGVAWLSGLRTHQFGWRSSHFVRQHSYIVGTHTPI